MTIEMVRVSLPALADFAEAGLGAMGCSAGQARLVGGALMFSELRFHPGQGQGVRRLRAYAERIAGGVIDVGTRHEVVKESPALALIDGHNALGSVTGIEAMRLAVAKAKVCGIGMAFVRGGSHYGSSAVHAAEAVAAGCIGVAMTNAGAEMAAWGGASPAVGTNPWAIAAPSGKGFDVSLDIALTTAGKGMMRWLSREGEKMPTDWALTPEGEETDDPEAAMTGALLGIGRYKGYGLALMTDVMTGVLTGGAFGLGPYSDPARQDVSHAFLALDIDWFMPLAEFTARMDRFIDEVKGGRLRPGFDEILVPGELEHRRAEDKRRNGVPLDRAVFDDLNALAETLGLDARLQDLAHAAA